MKRISMLLVVASALCVAQQPQQQQSQQQPPAGTTAPMPRSNVAARVGAPTYSDLYCAGFISKQAFSASNRIVGGVDSPHATQFSDRDIVFLEGSGYQEGARYSIVRELRDPNRYEPFKGQRGAISDAGQPYADLGRVRVTALRGSVAVADVEFSCAAMTSGDLVIPFQEKAPIAYRGKTIFERFPNPSGGVTGRIVMAKDFDTLAGTGRKVYLNVGSDKGVKVGDYFRALRGYDPSRMDVVEAYSFKAPVSEDTQKNSKPYSTGDVQKLPKRNLGEMIVLNVTPTSSTAMVTYSVEPINVGDEVETDNSKPVPPPPPPTISCAASPATVQVGGTTTIVSTASSPDNRRLEYSYAASAGDISGNEATATLSTVGAQPGVITVTCNVSDDRDPPLTASATTSVTVEAPPPPVAPPSAPAEPAKINDTTFKPSSARVDNVAKSILDDVALRLQHEVEARVVLIGEADPDERDAAKVAAQRAINAKSYLVTEKGIDARRIETRVGTQGGHVTQVWFVPSGASFDPPETTVIQ